MNWILIALYLAAGIASFCLGFSYREKELSVNAANPKEDRLYWKMITHKFQKGYYVGAVGALLAASGIALKHALAAEIGCIALMAAMVFNLAYLSRKLAFHPSVDTENLQKKWKLILLGASFGALLMTQFVFKYFLALGK